VSPLQPGSAANAARMPTIGPAAIATVPTPSALSSERRENDEARSASAQQSST